MIVLVWFVRPGTCTTLPNVAQGLDTGHNSIRVGIETFDSRPESQIHLNRFYSKADLIGAITDISYRSRGTDLGAAIEHMDNIMFQVGRLDKWTLSCFRWVSYTDGHCHVFGGSFTQMDTVMFSVGQLDI